MASIQTLCSFLQRTSLSKFATLSNVTVRAAPTVTATAQKSLTICHRPFSSAPLTPFDEDFSKMSNEELADTSTIPGWGLIHSPPRKFPRGALLGTVVSDKMNKTINVAVKRYRLVPKIRKKMTYTRKFMAHDEKEVANIGDLVMITPCHRLSKHKHFMLREIIRPKGQI
jgi:small subunit ribosomal protein S17